MDKKIIYNSAVAKRCGKNGIIKAVLINYIHNYNKHKPREGAGSPAAITLGEFAFQYMVGNDQALWKTSFIHETLKTMATSALITTSKGNGRTIYTLSPEILDLLKAGNAKLVSFDLELACQYGIYVAITSRYLHHVIKQNPKGQAFNLDIEQMSELNRISAAQIYRAIKFLVGQNIFKKVKPTGKRKSRAMCLALGTKNS